MSTKPSSLRSFARGTDSFTRGRYLWPAGARGVAAQVVHGDLRVGYAGGQGIRRGTAARNHRERRGGNARQCAEPRRALPAALRCA